jgi:hypothetical protein
LIFNASLEDWDGWFDFEGVDETMMDGYAGAAFFMKPVGDGGRFIVVLVRF